MLVQDLGSGRQPGSYGLGCGAGSLNTSRRSADPHSSHARPRPGLRPVHRPGPSPRAQKKFGNRPEHGILGTCRNSSPTQPGLSVCSLPSLRCKPLKFPTAGPLTLPLHPRTSRRTNPRTLPLHPEPWVLFKHAGPLAIRILILISIYAKILTNTNTHSHSVLVFLRILISHSLIVSSHTGANTNANATIYINIDILTYTNTNIFS